MLAIVGHLYFMTEIKDKLITYTSPKFLGLDQERRYIYEDTPTERTLVFTFNETARKYIEEHKLNNANNVEGHEVVEIWEEN